VLSFSIWRKVNGFEDPDPPSVLKEVKLEDNVLKAVLRLMPDRESFWKVLRGRACAIYTERYYGKRVMFWEANIGSVCVTWRATVHWEHVQNYCRNNYINILTGGGISKSAMIGKSLMHDSTSAAIEVAA